jgi:hypothetical protein
VRGDDANEWRAVGLTFPETVNVATAHTCEGHRADVPSNGYGIERKQITSKLEKG